jgi:taurine dioxygenase
VLIPLLNRKHIVELPRDFMYAGLLYSLPMGAVAGASAFGWMVAYLRGPRYRRHVHHVVAGNDGATIMFLLVVLFVIVGDFIDAVPAIIIFMPIIRKLTEVGNINSLHMGVVIITTLVFGLITPPYGLSLLVASKYVGVSFSKAVVRSLPLYIVFFLTIAFTVLFPKVVLWLPKQLLPESVGCFKSPSGTGIFVLLEPDRRRTRMSAVVDVRWPFAVRPLTPKLGAEISGVSLAEDISPISSGSIYDAFLRYQVLLFPPQDIPPGRQVAFARHFGEVQIHIMNQYHADGFPELYRLSNLDEKGNPNGRHPDKGTLEWHTDGSWSRVTGQATIIYGEVMPETGGETHFCDMYGAYERLSPAWKARIATLRAVHNSDFSRTRRHGEDPMTPSSARRGLPVDHPIVRTHPETGRKCIYLGDHAEYIVGMPYGEGRALIEELNRLAVHPDLTYEHRWKAGELLVWDNRCVMHRATPYDPATQRRVIRRCTVLGEVPA